MRFSNLVSFLTLLFISPFAFSQTWNGLGPNGNWSTNGNWDTAAPISGAAVTMAGTTNLATIQDIPLLSLSSLTFDSTAGAFTVSGGTLEIANAGSLIHNGNLDVSITTPLTFAGNATIGGNGDGLLILGTTAFQNGSVSINRNVTIGDMTIGVPSGTAVTLNTGSNVLTMAGNLTFVSQSGSNLNTPPATINGNIDLGGANRTFSGNFSNAPSPFIDVIINAVITGDGGFVKGGVGTEHAAFMFTAQNTYTGPTILETDSEFLYLGAVNAIPNTSAVTVSSGSILSLTSQNPVVTGNNGFSQTIGSLRDGNTGGGTVYIGQNNAATVLTTGGDNSSTTFSGQLLGGGSLVKVGSGTFILANNNSGAQSNYLSGTIVNGGTLLVNGQTGTNSGTGSGTVTVNTGATFGGNGRAAGAVTISSGGTIRGGDASAVGTLTLGGGLSVQAGGNVAVRVTGGSSAAANSGGSSGGTLPNPANNNFIDVTGGTIDWNNANFVIDGTGTSFTLNSPYSYQIARQGTSLTSLNILDQSRFSTVGFVASSFSVTGDSNGVAYLNFTPVPEPIFMATIAVAGVVGYRRFRSIRA